MNQGNSAMEQHAEAIYEKGVLRPTSLLLDLVDGQRVWVAVRPILEPEPTEHARRRAELIHRLEADGALLHFHAPSEQPPADFHPLVIEGEPLSETVIMNRR
jgi:predicted DNA-binding antitoxin AbrB/MazE fold protein